MSYDDFCKLPEGAGMQLIDGLYVREPGPGARHQAATGKLFVRLYSYVEAQGLGVVFDAPFDVIIEIGDVTQSLQPDILFVGKDRLDIVHERGVLGAPDLVIEALSPSTRRYDTGRKRELYLAHGCRELWLVDLDTPQIDVIVPDQDGNFAASCHGPGTTVESLTVPGFRFAVDDLVG